MNEMENAVRSYSNERRFSPPVRNVSLVGMTRPEANRFNETIRRWYSLISRVCFVCFNRVGVSLPTEIAARQKVLAARFVQINIHYH